MFPLFAQQAEMPVASLSVIPLVVTAVLVVVVPMLFFSLFLLIRNGQRRREWEHAERMRTLEMGLPLPPRDAPWARATVCVAIGVFVPVIAYVATTAAFYANPKAPGELWVAPAVISVVSVIVSAFVFVGISSSARPTGEDVLDPHRSGSNVKPSDDPDALDVVGRRG